MQHTKAMICRFLLVIGLLFSALLLVAAGKVIDVTKAGVVGDGTTLNAASIQKVIDDCTVNGGSCTILFPAGRYLTGTIQIKSNVTLRIEKGATILGSTEKNDYRNIDPFIDGSGNPMEHALIVAVDASNVGAVLSFKTCGQIS